MIDEHAPVEDEPTPRHGIRSWLLMSYDIGKFNYAEGLTGKGRKNGSPVKWANEIGVLLWYGCQVHIARSRRTPMNVDTMAARWHTMIVGLATAHSKDDADRFEASVDEILTPVLSAPVKQLRALAERLRDSLKADPAVPYLVWRGLEAWIDKIVLLAPDEEIKELKTELAKEIVDMVEEDVKRDLPAAMIRALQWRSPEKLAEVKAVVENEKKAGRPVRLRGRESCLFLEAGGTEDEPKVCVQV